MPEHVDIVDGKRHEPKGASTAIAETVYVADGAGSGTWKGVEPAGVASQVEGKFYVADGAGSGSWKFLPHGWGYYQDAATSPATQVLTTTPQLLQIDGAGANSNESYLPKEILGTGSLWDAATDTMTPITEGDSYNIRVDLDISAETGAPTFIEAEFDIGGQATPTIVIVDRIVGLAKNAPYQVSIAFPVFSLATFLANGMQIFLCVDAGTITIGERAITIQRVSAGDQ